MLRPLHLGLGVGDSWCVEPGRGARPRPGVVRWFQDMGVAHL